MRQAVWTVDPDLPIRSASTLEAITSDLIAGPRFYALLSSSFAGAALLLALVGVYGTAAHAASRRRRELGIRVALGAEAAAIVRMVMRDGLMLAAVGVLLGAVASRLLGDLLSGLLFGVSEGDMSTLAACATLFLATSCIASLIPALRAAFADPVVALRRD
jgi:ABC-type antimicrobial peptide transport system permease subunit